MNEQPSKPTTSVNPSEQGGEAEVILPDIDTNHVLVVSEAMQTVGLGSVRTEAIQQKWDSKARDYIGGVFTYRITGEPVSLARFQTLVNEAINYSATIDDLLGHELREKVQMRVNEAAAQIKGGTFAPTSPPSSRTT